MDKEKTQEILFEKRILSLIGEITREKMMQLREKLFFLNSKSNEKIILIIDTPGGEVVGAFLLYGALSLSKAPVVAIVNGECSSSGILVLQGAKKRLATRGSFFYLHPFSISFEKEPIPLDERAESKIREKLEAARNRQKIFYNILIKKTKLDFKEIKAIEEKIIFAKRAKELGLIDEVIEKYEI